MPARSRENPGKQYDHLWQLFLNLKRPHYDATRYSRDLSVAGPNEIGPADAGLIYVAAHQKATILSEDGELVRWARIRSVPAVSLQEIGFGGT